MTPHRNKRGEATRRRIVTVARTRLVEDGYDQVALRSIASELDIALGNLQYYFATRDDLIEQIITTEADDAVRQLRDLVDSDGAPDQILRRVVAAMVERWRGESGRVFSTMSFLALHNTTFAEVYRATYAAFYEELERAIDCAAPELDARERATRARLLTALIDGAALQIMVGPKDEFLAAVAASASMIAFGPAE